MVVEKRVATLLLFAAIFAAVFGNEGRYKYVTLFAAQADYNNNNYSNIAYKNYKCSPGHSKNFTLAIVLRGSGQC